MFKSTLDKIKHKDTYGPTTSRKFKEDMIEILMDKPWNGDILEVGIFTGETTLILAKIAEKLNKKVYAFEQNSSYINQTQRLLKAHNITNVEIQLKDVYTQEWTVENIGCTFIDCVHTQMHIRQDIHNTKSVMSGKGFVFVHDYGLIDEHGQSIKPYIDICEITKIVRFMGEESDWDNIQHGKIVDWEAAQLEFI
jgi:phospholipid N-methyltransferase